MFTKNGYFRNTGDPDVDRQLDRAIKIAANILQVRPAFGFIDPDKFSDRQLDGMNAFASTRDADIPGTRGIVAFGMTKFRSELHGYDESGTTVMAIIAHEFGHILQNYRGYLASIRTLQCEINADFLSGYYLGVRKHQVSSVSFEKAAELFNRLGRAESGNPNRTHGDPNERVSAAAAGFKAGFSQNMNLEDAVRAGLAYIGYRPT
jgi:hypothetical protein